MNLLSKFNDTLIISEIPERGEKVHSFEWKHLKMNTGTRLDKTSLTPAKAYTPTSKDRLFFYPGCNVPRFKVRDWGKKNKISVTISQEKANAKFATSATFSTYVSNRYHIKMKTDEFIKWLDLNYDASYTGYGELMHLLDTHQDKFVLISNSIIGIYPMMQHNYNGILYVKTMQELDPDIDRYNYSQVVDDDNWKDFVSLCTDPNIYSQESIIGLINEDATTINSELYNELRTMIAADDRKNVVMAMEIMGSSNLNTSCHHVMLLLREFGEKLFGFREKNHVNFKSMIEFLGLKGSWTNITDDIMIQTLMDKEVLTMDILTEICEAVKTVMSKESNTKHFIISKITVSDEVKNYFKDRPEAMQQTTQPELQHA